jgi:undecaprenyl-diphosphatase
MAMNSVDSNLVVWLNGLAGHLPWLDAVLLIIASDYLLPLSFSLLMFGLWFVGSDRAERERIQFLVLVGISAIGLSNAAVWQLNLAWPRLRPYETLAQIELLFYPSTDPSFPANPVAVGFAAGAAAWMVNRRLGAIVCGIAFVYGLTRMYAGVFYLTDVLAGAAVGVVVTWGTLWLFRVCRPIPEFAIRLARGFALG